MYECVYAQNNTAFAAHQWQTQQNFVTHSQFEYVS